VSEANLVFRPLGAAQLTVLAALEIDIYQRRQLPRVAPPVAPAMPAQAAPAAAVTWTDADVDSPLARAIARAAHIVDVRQWSKQWLAAHLSLPDLAQLRADAPAKRALWRLIRRRLSA